MYTRLCSYVPLMTSSSRFIARARKTRTRLHLSSYLCVFATSNVSRRMKNVFSRPASRNIKVFIVYPGATMSLIFINVTSKGVATCAGVCYSNVFFEPWKYYSLLIISWMI